MRSNAGLCTKLRNRYVLFSGDDDEGKISFLIFSFSLSFFGYRSATRTAQSLELLSGMTTDCRRGEMNS
jgi:hypothetical protein